MKYFLSFLQIGLILLKVAGIISIVWGLVLLPTWIGIFLFVLSFVIFMVAGSWISRSYK